MYFCQYVLPESRVHVFCGAFLPAEKSGVKNRIKGGEGKDKNINGSSYDTVKGEQLKSLVFVLSNPSLPQRLGKVSVALHINYPEVLPERKDACFSNPLGTVKITSERVSIKKRMGANSNT